MPVKLTPTRVSKATPRDIPYEMADSEVPGLLLRVQPSGVKSFIVTWRRGRRMTLGKAGRLTIEQARVKARKVLNDAAEHGEPRRVATNKRDATLGEFLREHYKLFAEQHQRDAKGNLQAIETEFGHLFDTALAQLSVFTLERYRLAKLRAGVKPATVNRHFDRIRALLSKAVEWNHLAQHPLAKLKDSKTDRCGVVRWLTDKEEPRLRKALEERDARMREERRSANLWRQARGYAPYPEIADFGDWLTPMVLVSMNTGCRRGELRHLFWQDIDLERAMLTVRGTHAKSGQTRHIPLNAEALDVLKRWKAVTTQPQGAVFGVLRVDKAWKAVLAGAKIASFRWHDLRHHFASKLVLVGVDLNTVRELLGHAGIAMTLRYAHLAPKHKAEAVARLVA